MAQQNVKTILNNKDKQNTYKHLMGKYRNQKIEPSLRAAMQATTEELEKSGDLATGFSEEENLWEVIILNSGAKVIINTEYSKQNFSIPL